MTGSVRVVPPRRGIAPYFIVEDVVATANYHRDKLGLTYERCWNEPPSFCRAQRNCIVIMLAQPGPPVTRDFNNHSTDEFK